MFHPDEDPDRRRARRRVRASDPDDLVRFQPRELGGPLGRIVVQTLTQSLEARRVPGDVVVVLQPFVDDDVHHAQGEGRVRAGHRPICQSAAPAVLTSAGR